MTKYDLNEVLEFLNIWRTRKEVSEKFGLSNSQSWHLLRWLVKGGYVDQIKNVNITKYHGLVTLYKTKK